MSRHRSPPSVNDRTDHWMDRSLVVVCIDGGEEVVPEAMKRFTNGQTYPLPWT